MKKKLLSIILTVLIILTCSVSSFAQTGIVETSSKISRDTIITKDNLNEILKLYGIDATELKKSDAPVSQAAMTVGQLEDAINLIRSETEDQIITEIIDNGEIVGSDGTLISPRATPVTGSVYLSHTTSPMSTFDATYTCTGTYTKDLFSGYKAWTGADNASVTINDKSAPGAKRQLDSVSSIGATYTGSTVTLSTTYVVGYYLVIGIPDSPFSYEQYMSSNTIRNTSYWGTSYIPD